MYDRLFACFPFYTRNSKHEAAHSCVRSIRTVFVFVFVFLLLFFFVFLGILSPANVDLQPNLAFDHDFLFTSPSEYFKERPMAVKIK